MGSKGVAVTALFLSFNLIFFSTLSSAQSPPAPVASPMPNCPLIGLNVCASLLNLVTIQIGASQTNTCCPLINGLVNLDAAVCLCAAIRANVLGIINVDATVAVDIILNRCGQRMPPGFVCRV
ncbi:Hydrophobic seed protein [Sesbania bispinosa]|nr:Hydrophobic seed protein [Sesbania bispinosa]